MIFLFHPKFDALLTLVVAMLLTEADLLEALLTHAEAYLPARIDLLMEHLERLAVLRLIALHVQVHVALEAIQLDKYNSTVEPCYKEGRI